MSLACRCRQLTLPASASICCTKSFPTSAIWQSWAMSKSHKSLLEMNEVETAAQKFNLKVIRLEARRAEDFAPALASLNGRAQALYVCADPLTVLNRMSINTLASAARSSWPAA
jgi:hypothetical protein